MGPERAAFPRCVDIKESIPFTHLLVASQPALTAGAGLGLRSPVTLVETQRALGSQEPAFGRSQLVNGLITHLHRPPPNGFQTGCLEEAATLPSAHITQS